jgi:hypothetical protein
MKKETLLQIIREEISNELKNSNFQLNEVYDLEQVKYSASVQKHVDNLVNALSKTSSLTKPQVAAILNDIILALGLNRTQITMYMSMIKQSRQKYDF